MLVETSRPRLPIRRFDIFAEWNRIKARQRHHLPENEARAYGLAVAKVVAARKFSGYQPEQIREWRAHARREEVTKAWWKHLGSGPEFERKVVERMGPAFYAQVFQPAVRRAWDAGKSYEEIRDLLRQEWNEALAE